MITINDINQAELYFEKCVIIFHIGGHDVCGRYYVDDNTIREIERLVYQIDEKLKIEREKDRYPSDIYPSYAAPIIAEENQKLLAKLFQWGYPHYKNKGVIFNARSETVLEKQMFRNSVKSHRCVIPAKSFYEWNKEKEKYTFLRPDCGILYFAGIYNQFSEENRFVILTTKANESMQKVHERMPLILEKNQIQDWICDDQAIEFILQQKPIELKSKTEYEQQTLDL